MTTTPPDPRQASRQGRAALDRAGRDNEPDPRPIGVTPPMDPPRGKAPGRARQEVRTRVPADDPTRAVMARAAAGEGVAPRSIGFMATLPVPEATRPPIAGQAHHGAGHRATLSQQVPRAIAVHRVADRPDRFESRMAMRRPKRCNRLTRPRRGIKPQMLERVSKI